ncbi:MAG TPA: DUF2157 domain-containing protein [Mycobacteriales bacterium]|nr:DUF2157 domain-containing protein [Mycobacteriales bacterium]
MTREIPAKQLEWLSAEVAAWQRDGIVDDDTATAVLARYRAGRKASVLRLISVLGAAFVGVGLISLVASNVDRMSPLLRFAGITAVWIGAVVVAEVLLRRDPTADDGHGTLGVGAARVIAVAAYGATVFQAAQSLQVPAYSSSLLGCWALGALAYAYASRGIGPLVVGIVTLVGWFGWAVGERGDSAAAVIVAVVAAAVVATSVSAMHEGGPVAHFAPPWAYIGALLALGGLFAAAIPDAGEEPLTAAPTLIAVGAAVAVAGLATVRGSQQVRLEVTASVGVLLATLLLLGWHPDDAGGRATLSAAELTHAVVATALYLAAAVWCGVVGVSRERPQLTNLATAALVIFVTVQSFGVFAPLFSGAALFLVLGVILIAVGALADRGRRRLIEEVAE